MFTTSSPIDLFYVYYKLSYWPILCLLQALLLTYLMFTTSSPIDLFYVYYKLSTYWPILCLLQALLLTYFMFTTSSSIDLFYVYYKISYWPILIVTTSSPIDLFQWVRAWCFLMPSEQYFHKIMQRTNHIWMRWWECHIVLDQQA
jgi:hypothetical protein